MSVKNASFKQLTFAEHFFDGEFADPSPPFLGDDGSIEIHGTGPFFLLYKNWDDFLHGRSYEKIPSKFAQYDAWDVRRFRIFKGKTYQKDVFLFGGIPREEGSSTRHRAKRRIYLYEGDQIKTISCIPKADSKMYGHSYGGNYFQAGQTNPNAIDIERPFYFFFEQVSQVVGSHPFHTDIFRAKMKSLTESSEPPEAIVGPSLKPYPAMKRTLPGGGFLVEGPRPFEFRDPRSNLTVYLITFSTGDFVTHTYTTAVAWSEHPEGDFKIIEDSRGDLYDFGEKFKKAFDLTGFGRPVLFQTPTGEIQFLTHAYLRSENAEHDFSKWEPGTDLRKLRRFLFKGNASLSFSETRTLKVDFHLDHALDAIPEDAAKVLASPADA